MVVKKIINDFSITIATVNGSGSQTANVTLLRAFFKMGIPVSGKIYSLPISRDCQPGIPFV